MIQRFLKLLVLSITLLPTIVLPMDDSKSFYDTPEYEKALKKSDETFEMRKNQNALYFKPDKPDNRILIDSQWKQALHGVVGGAMVGAFCGLLWWAGAKLFSQSSSSCLSTVRTGVGLGAGIYGVVGALKPIDHKAVNLYKKTKGLSVRQAAAANDAQALEAHYEENHNSFEYPGGILDAHQHAQMQITPLHIAAANGADRAVRVILSRMKNNKKYIDKADWFFDKQTALLRAVKFGNAVTAAQLLYFGADFAIRDGYNKNAKSYIDENPELKAHQLLKEQAANRGLRIDH